MEILLAVYPRTYLAQGYHNKWLTQTKQRTENLPLHTKRLFLVILHKY